MIDYCFLVRNLPNQTIVGILLNVGSSAIVDMTAGRDANVDLSIHLPWSPDDAGLIFNNVTLPGILMSFLWGLLLISIVFVFDEPLRVNAADEAHYDCSSSIGKDRTSKMGWLVNSSTSLFQVIFKNGAFPVSMEPIEPLVN